MELVRLAELARQMGISACVVKKWCEEQGITPTPIKLKASRRPILLYDVEVVKQAISTLNAESELPSPYVKRTKGCNTVLGKSIAQLGKELRGN